MWGAYYFTAPCVLKYQYDLGIDLYPLLGTPCGRWVPGRTLRPDSCVRETLPSWRHKWRPLHTSSVCVLLKALAVRWQGLGFREGVQSPGELKLAAISVLTLSSLLGIGEVGDCSSGVSLCRQLRRWRSAGC